MAENFSVTQEISRYMGEIETQLARIVVISESVSAIRARLSDQAELSRDHVSALDEAALAATSIREAMLGVKSGLDGVLTALARLSSLLTDRTQVVSEVIEGLSGRVMGLHGSLDEILDQAGSRLETMTSSSAEVIRSIEDSYRESESRMRRALEDAELSLDRSRRDLAVSLAAVPEVLEESMQRLLVPVVDRVDHSRVRLEEMIESSLAPAMRDLVARAEAIGQRVEGLSSSMENAVAEGLSRGAAVLEPVHDAYRSRIEETDRVVGSLSDVLSNADEYVRLARALEESTRVAAENAEIQRAIRDAVSLGPAPVGHRLQVAGLGAALSFLVARYGLDLAGDTAFMIVVPSALVALWGEPIASRLLQSRAPSR